MQYKSLDQQLIEYRQQRALAMPLSGMILWSILFALSFTLSDSQMVMTPVTISQSQISSVTAPRALCRE